MFVCRLSACMCLGLSSRLVLVFARYVRHYFIFVKCLFGSALRRCFHCAPLVMVLFVLHSCIIVYAFYASLVVFLSAVMYYCIVVLFSLQFSIILVRHPFSCRDTCVCCVIYSCSGICLPFYLFMFFIAFITSLFRYVCMSVCLSVCLSCVYVVMPLYMSV